MSVSTSTIKAALFRTVVQLTATEKIADLTERALGGNMRHWILALPVLCLTACATHRNDPPQCKGPFTPINQPSSVVTNGSQR